MNKKLLAVAVAGALAAPGIALAQSSVTISGLIKMSVQGFKISNPSAARNGANTSQYLLHDDSSRIIFNVAEDLGGGLQAIAQIDWRIVPDNNSAGSQGVFLPTDGVSGNNHLGFRSKQWGRIFVGMQDVHYFGRESDLTVRNDLQADSVSLLAYVAGAGIQQVAGSQGSGGSGAIAGATRTRNIVHYTTPNWGGFSGIVAYSFNPNAPEADINSAATTNTTRKGYAWNIAPTFEARNFTIGYSYWSSKADNRQQTPATLGIAGGGANIIGNENQRGDRLFGSYRWGGFRIGAAWDKSKVSQEGVANAWTGSTTVAKRDAWSIPIEYTWGPHWIGGHYTKANDDKATNCGSVGAVGAAACAANSSADRDGAKMWAIGYNYSLSKRTSVGITYAQISNDPGAIYTLFTSNGGLGGGAAHTSNPGEDPRMWSMTVRHAF
jgi:predicted porin